MKRLIIFLLLFAALKVAGQTIGHLRFDTVMIYKVGGTGELALMNATKDTLGLLTNYGNGRTRFIKSRALNDSTIVAGLDTLVIRGNLSMITASNGLTKTANDIALGGTLSQNTSIEQDAFDLSLRAGFVQRHLFKANGDAAFGIGNKNIGINTSTPTTRLDVRGQALIANNATFFQFTGWPATYESSFNHNILGIFGDEPSLDILIDSNSQFNIGGITFRSLDGIVPKLPSNRFGFNAGGKIEYNAFANSDTTSTMEFYLGDRDSTTIHVFALSNKGVHFFGNRKVFTAESKEALMFGTAIKGVNSTLISGLTDTTYFAGDAGNKPMWWFNMPTVAPDTSAYRFILQHKTNGSVYAASYWPLLGSGGGAGGSAYGIDSTVIGGTPGSALYVGTNGLLQESPADYFYDSTNKELGIGTNAPNSRLDITTNNLGVTQTNTSGIVLSNNTAATIGNQQKAPGFRFRANGFATTPAASQTIDLRWDLLPVQGAAAPTWQLLMSSSINGGAYTNPFNYTSDGSFTAGGQLTAGTHLSFSGTGQIISSGRFRLAPQADGVVALLNSGQTSFGRLIWGPATSSFWSIKHDAGGLLVRNGDDTDYGDLSIKDEAYSESAFNGSLEAVTKNAMRDEVETIRYKPYSQTASLVTNTSDATPTNMSVLYGLTTLPDNSNGWFKVTLTGNGQNGASTHSLHGIKYYSYHKTGGTLTLDAADVIVADKKGASVSTATWQVIVSSNQPVIEVTGVAAITMVWGAAVEIVYVVEN